MFYSKYCCINICDLLSYIDVWLIVLFRLPYQQICGGVVAIEKSQFIALNGFSNNYWGWGGEDDDMFKRINAAAMILIRPNIEVARYFMINHPDQTRLNTKRYRFDV